MDFCRSNVIIEVKVRGKGKYKQKRRKNIIWWVMIALIVTIVFVMGIIT